MSTVSSACAVCIPSAADRSFSNFCITSSLSSYPPSPIFSYYKINHAARGFPVKFLYVHETNVFALCILQENYYRFFWMITWHPLLCIRRSSFYRMIQCQVCFFDVCILPYDQVFQNRWQPHLILAIHYDVSIFLKPRVGILVDICAHQLPSAHRFP